MDDFYSQREREKKALLAVVTDIERLRVRPGRKEGDLQTIQRPPKTHQILSTTTTPREDRRRCSPRQVSKHDDDDYR